MVVDLDPDYLAGAVNRATKSDVFVRWFRGTARVVVGQDEPKRRVLDGGMQDFARVRPCGVQGTNGDRLTVDQSILRVEIEADEVLFLEALDVGNAVEDVERPYKSHALTVLGRAETPLQFEDCDEPLREREADTGNLLKFLDGQTV